MIWKQVLLLSVLLPSGCATLEGKPTATSPCAFEQVWDTALVTLEGARLQKADKAADLGKSNAS